MSKLSCLWEKAVLRKKVDHITLMKNKKIHTFGKFISTNQHKLRLIKSIYNELMWCGPEREMVVMVELIRIYMCVKRTCCIIKVISPWDRAE